MKTYTVVSGDTLSKIAKKFGTTYQEIAQINGISNPNIIQVGQILKIPGSNSSNTSSPSPAPSPSVSYTSYRVISGDTLSKISQKFGTTYQELARINGISNPNLIQVGQVLKVPGNNSNPSSSPAPSSSSNSNSNNNVYKPITINVNGTKMFEILINSKWSSKAGALSKAYDVILENGYSVECAIGLMANFFAEGNYGIVEYSFSINHSYDIY